MKILIVEDDYNNAFVTNICLEEFGFICDVAQSGLQALEKIEENSYDVVLMDIGMRGMDGYQTTKAIRDYEEKGGKPPLTIIGVTGYALSQDRDKCLEAGMDDYLSKPYNPEALRVKIIEVFSA